MDLLTQPAQTVGPKSGGSINSQTTGTPVQVAEAGKGGYSTALIELSGTFTATITWKGSMDGVVYHTIMATPLATGTAATTATAVGLFRIDIRGLKFIRADATAFTSGPVVVDVHLLAN